MQTEADDDTVIRLKSTATKHSRDKINHVLDWHFGGAVATGMTISVSDVRSLQYCAPLLRKSGTLVGKGKGYNGACIEGLQSAYPAKTADYGQLHEATSKFVAPISNLPQQLFP